MAGLFSPQNPPKVIMLPNEKFALECRARYEEQGLIVDKTNGYFAHSPLTRKECDTGYYLLWNDHQHQGLLQSRDLGKCCFWVGDVKKWLIECDYWPVNYFELWDIYEQYSKVQCQIGGRKSAEKKDKNGKSVNAVKAGKKAHEKRDENGKSINGVKYAKRSHEKKDELGRSILGVKNAERLLKTLHKEKDELGRSRHAVKAAKAAAAVRSKRIEITFQNGRIGTYATCKLAAIALGVTPSSITHWAKGKNKPSLPVTVRYV